MKHYKYQETLHSIWQKAVDLYQQGNRDSGTYFDGDETDFLSSIGANAQEIYDFAEDFVSSGVPDFTTVAIIHDIRRAYFREVQNQTPSGEVLDPAILPAPQVEAAGIRWLPRIIQKAKAKLRGELHPDVMYSCGGDRHFLEENDIHAGEFLRVVWENEKDEAAVVDWVASRVKSESPVTAS